MYAGDVNIVGGGTAAGLERCVVRILVGEALEGYSKPAARWTRRRALNSAIKEFDVGVTKGCEPLIRGTVRKGRSPTAVSLVPLFRTVTWILASCS